MPSCDTAEVEESRVSQVPKYHGLLNSDTCDEKE